MRKVLFSVIIPAFGSAEFIEDCLRSIVNQSLFFGRGDYEILVGVDGCADTLQKLSQIKWLYPGLRIFWFPKNRGPYVVKNTLAYLASGEYLIFFDSDDWMLPRLVEWCSKNMHREAPTKFRFIMFGENRPNIVFKKGANGAFGIRKDVFLELGGFLPWRCSADSEFHVRATKAKGDPRTSEEPLVMYRKHAGCLTVQQKTGANSILRRRYRNIVRKEKTKRALATKITPVFSEFEEIK